MKWRYSDSGLGNCQAAIVRRSGPAPDREVASCVARRDPVEAGLLGHHQRSRSRSRPCRQRFTSKFSSPANLRAVTGFSTNRNWRSADIDGRACGRPRSRRPWSNAAYERHGAQPSQVDRCRIRRVAWERPQRRRCLEADRQLSSLAGSGRSPIALNGLAQRRRHIRVAGWGHRPLRFRRRSIS